MHIMRMFKLILALALVLASARSQAALVWDPDTDLIDNGGAGTWDASTTANWESSGANVVWTNGEDAVFGSSGSDYTVTIQDAGVTVRNITLTAGTGKVRFDGASADMGQITVAAGGATWNTGGREIEIFNVANNETPLSISSGDTLTISGGGVFDTGGAGNVNPNTPTWSATGATLEVTQPTVVRADTNTVGRFSTVKIAAGSRFDHARNSPRTYTNAWELTGTGFVNFDPSFTNSNPKITLTGVVSGTAGIEVSDASGNFVKLTNTANSFTGGIVVDSGDSRSELQNTNGDGAFGAVPASFDPDNITLRNGGELKMQGITIHPNRGITLDNGGIIVNTGAANTYGGTVTGTGGLQIGRPQGSDGNKLILTGDTNNFTGGTSIVRGSLELGINDALPNDTVLTIGGFNTTEFRMNGFDQEIGGLNLASGTSNTRQIHNGGASMSTLTINVPAGETHNYAGNFVGTNTIALVKSGDGKQILSRPTTPTVAPAIVTINGGTLEVTGPGLSTMTGDVTVNGGVLGTDGTIGGQVNVIAGTLSPGIDAAPVGTATLNNNLALQTAAILEFNLEGTDTTVGGGANDLIALMGDLTLDGTLDISEVTADSFLDAMEGDSWTLLTYTGSLIDNGLDLGAAPALASGLDYSIQAGGGIVSLSIVAIPEPSQLLLIASLICGIGLTRSAARSK